MNVEVAVSVSAVEPAQTQNLFEYAAQNARGLSEGAGPQQVGSEVMQSLEGYIERSGTLSTRTQDVSQTPAAPSFVSIGTDSLPPQPPQQETPVVAESDMDRAVDTLGQMFDHAIETQLVVRGATQVAGAANTLLRGQ